MEIESPVPSPLQRARAKLLVPPQPERPYVAVAAAALFAVCALTFAAASILAPPVTLEHMAKTSVQ